MAYSPSTRMKDAEEGELNLNLNPMMDMFAVLIPALLMMSVVVEISIVNVSAPSIGGADANEKAPDEPPLNLAVSILDSGYAVSTLAGPLPGADGTADSRRPTVPVVERTIVCSRYRGTRPPPRTKNADRPACAKGDPFDKKVFWVYDTEALNRLVTDLKNAHPTERRIIIGGSNDVEYEALVDVMDATRDTKSSSDEIRTLFDEVILRPGQ